MGWFWIGTRRMYGLATAAEPSWRRGELAERLDAGRYRVGARLLWPLGSSPAGQSGIRQKGDEV